jgi:hypothetical protein
MYRAAARITLLGLVMGLSACAVQPTGPRNQEPIPNLPGQTQPAVKPGSPTIPQAPAAAPKTSSNFAPPPGGNSRHLLPPAYLLPLEQRLDLVHQPQWPLAGHRRQRRAGGVKQTIWQLSSIYSLLLTCVAIRLCSPDISSGITCPDKSDQTHRRR